MANHTFVFNAGLGLHKQCPNKWGWEVTIKGARSHGIADSEVEALAEGMRTAYSYIDAIHAKNVDASPHEQLAFLSITEPFHEPCE